MDVKQIVISVVELFIIIFLGYFLIWKGIIKKEALKHISGFLFYVSMPMLILNSMVNPENINLGDVLGILLVSFGLYGMMFLLAMVLPKLLRIDETYKGLYRFLTMFGNVGFIGFPVIIAILGEDALFYASIFNIPFNLLAFSLGIMFITSDTRKQTKFQWKQVLNPALVATLIGLVLFFIQLPVPDLAVKVLDRVGSTTIPLSLIVVGGSLYGMSFLNIIKKYKIVIISAIKLFILPVVITAVVTVIGISGEIAAVAIIISGMPISANSVIISQEYDGHVLEASEAVFLSTIMVAASVPLLVLLTNMVL